MATRTRERGGKAGNTVRGKGVVSTTEYKLEGEEESKRGAETCAHH